ncbi:hypothetical protein [Arcticibacter tournemirensis]
MKKVIAKKIISVLFLSIFVSKMVISVAPLIVAHFDSKTVNAVIMQLEIEHSKPVDGKESCLKEYIALVSYCYAILSPVWTFNPLTVNRGYDKHHQPFYPSVPTPPPNA